MSGGQPNPSSTVPVSASQQTSAALYLTQALQTNWQTMEIDLGSGKKPYSRNECQDFLDKQILQRAGAAQKQKIGNLDSFESLEHANLFLINEAYQQEVNQTASMPADQQKIYLNNYKTALDNYQLGLQRLISSNLTLNNSDLPSIDLVRPAASAKLGLQTQVGNDIEKIAISNTHGFYPEHLKKIVGTKLNQEVQQAVYKYLTNDKELDQEFMDKEVRRIIRQSPYLSTALGSERKIIDQLGKTLAKTDKTTFLSNYNQVRNLQLGMDPVYHSLLFRLNSAGLSSPDARKVIDEFSSHAGNMALGSHLHTYQSQFFLRQALAKYNNLKVSPDTLAFEFANIGQLSGNAPSYLNASAKNLGTSPQALQAYLRGLTPEQLRNFGQKDLADQTEALHKALNNPQATALLKTQEQQLKKTQVEKLSQDLKTAKNRKEKKAIKEKINAISQDKMSDVDRAIKQRQINEKANKKWHQKLEKKLKHEQFLHTTKRGKVLRTFNRTAGFAGKVMGVPANIMSFPGRFASKQFANALMRIGAHDAGVNFIEHGFKGLIGNIITKGKFGKFIGKKLFASIFGGAIGSAAVIASTLAQNWQQIGQAAAVALGSLFYLFSQFPATIMGAAGGFAAGGLIGLGPLGMIAGAGVGYFIDSSVGLIKGIGAAANTASSAATVASTAVNSLSLETGVAANFTHSLAGISLGGIGGITIAGALLVNTVFLPSVMQTTDAREVGGGIDYPSPTVNPEAIGIESETDCQDPGCKLMFALQKCGAADLIITKTTWNYINQECLRNEGISQDAINELHHSVFDIENNAVLQCVGFKIAAEKLAGVDLPRQNAVAFTYWSGDYRINPGTPSVGANIVWGPRDACSTQTPEEANALCETENVCCGHIGIVSKIDDDSVYYISANADGDGKVTMQKIPKTLNQEEQGPWRYISH